MQFINKLILLASCVAAIPYYESDFRSDPVRRQTGGSPPTISPNATGVPLGANITLHSVTFGGTGCPDKAFNIVDGVYNLSTLAGLKQPSFSSRLSPNSTQVESSRFCGVSISLATNGWQFRVVGKKASVPVAGWVSVAANATAYYKVDYYFVAPTRQLGGSGYYRVIGPVEGNFVVPDPDPSVVSDWSPCNDVMFNIDRQLTSPGKGAIELKAGNPLVALNSFEWRKCT